MQITLKGALLRVGLATLAMPLAALNASSSPANAAHHLTPGKPVTAKKHVAKSAKSTRGEADSLQTQEASANAEEREVRDDNRGRLTSASHRPHATKPVLNTVYHGPKSTAATATRAPQHHAATLQTGQLTARQRSHLKTKETALHPVRSDHKQNRRRTPADPATGGDSPDHKGNSLHLKKHNARMF